MDVFTAISQRSSVRAYKATGVEEDKLKKILEAARLSPSASNRQDWKFIVVKNKEIRKKLVKAAFGQSFIRLRRRPWALPMDECGLRR